jgi:NAD(P)-dependent dehydrogenase (short-subunit alcohol dehydrogenase family)
MTKTILLTGGTGKFGKILVSHFALNGWKVVTTSRSQSRIDQIISEIGKTKEPIIGIEIDLFQEKAPEKLIKELGRKEISITHLINNARSQDSLAVQENGTTHQEDFLNEMKMNVIIPYQLTIELAFSKMHQLKSVVNIGSMYGIIAPNPKLYDGSLNNSPIQYGTSKAALHHLTRELAVRLASQDIRVNCVAFGGVEGRADESFHERYAQLVPSRRMLKESEIIGPINFLVEDSSSSVNGHILIADGGWSIW